MMKKTTGQKIIVLADVVLGLCFASLFIGVLGLLAGVIIAIIDDTNVKIVFVFCAIYFLIALACYISSLLIRGYGELVNNSEKVCSNTELIEKLLSDKQTDAPNAELAFCEVCKTPQPRTNRFCCGCGISMETEE